VRLFLALELPAQVRAALADVQERLRAGEPGWRFVHPQGVHLTLRFLGEVPEPRLLELSPRWRAAASSAEPADVEVAGLGIFPPRGRPRVLWIGLQDRSGGALAALAQALEAEARAAGFPPEDRPFAPHLTLARAAAEGRPRRSVLELGLLGAFRAESVTLFRSVPGRGGAVYTALEHYPIGSGATPRPAG
jgi:2'-5' RNA ligase